MCLLICVHLYCMYVCSLCFVVLLIIKKKSISHCSFTSACWWVYWFDVITISDLLSWHMSIYFNHRPNLTGSQCDWNSSKWVLQNQGAKFRSDMAFQGKHPRNLAQEYSKGNVCQHMGWRSTDHALAVGINDPRPTVYGSNFATWFTITNLFWQKCCSRRLGVICLSILEDRMYLWDNIREALDVTMDSYTRRGRGRRIDADVHRVLLL